MKHIITKINRRKLAFAALLGALLPFGNAGAQSSLDLRINEVLVFNDSNYVDDFGQHSAWIEIFNSAYNTVDMGGLYLTNDLSNPTMYKIPKGQPITAIAPRSFLVFWADGHESNGILHLNFKLEDSKLVALYDANGRTLIDSIHLPLNAKHDVTFGFMEDGLGQRAYLPKSTPMSSNVTTEKVTGAEIFATFDKSGFAMMAIAMSVVFSALAILFIFYKNLGRILNRKKKAKSDISDKTVSDEGISGEINAAIVMALYLYKNQLHDHENAVLTINKVAKAYSPWSSKIYGMRRWPRA
jgi:Na+-transporting methylmalonyl-CoA/oxaloacetate decarboxylase gamma subunit